MRATNLLENVQFRDTKPNSEPLFVDAHGRVLRFSLKPGQAIEEHRAPNSPFYVVVLEGHGIFTGKDGAEIQVGPNALLIFEPGETHSVRALDEELVFVGFLHGVAGARPDKTGGTLSHDA